jgi:predicted ATPase
METVLIGLNATGKSNLLEAIVIIFRDLDLERPPQISKSQAALEYYIKYECRKKDIEIEYSSKNNYHFKIDSQIVSKTTFNKNKDEYLPRHVFIYYSGLSERLKDLYYEHTKRYYEKIIRPEAKHERFDKMPRIFLAQSIHASFALIAFYMFKDREKEAIQFLKDELKILDFGSALFILKQPDWSKSRKTVDKFWNAGGLVRRFLEDLYRFSTAPIYNEERVNTTYKKSETQSRLYLFIKDRGTFKTLVDLKMYADKIPLFNALNSIDISDLLFDVKIKVAKANVKGELSMGELSEGEKQLITVLGLLKFTKDDESLILLDEPDTHLNPLWKWKYLYYLDQVVKRPDSTQIIFCTHDPLVIGSMEKSQVRVFSKDAEGVSTVVEPDISPRGLGVAGILTSELFGLPTTLDNETQGLLDQKNELTAKQNTKNGLSKKEQEELRKISDNLNELGFTKSFRDPLYQKFIVALSKRPEFQKKNYTKEELKEQNEIASKILDEIIKEENK